MVVENYCSRIKIKIDIQVGGFSLCTPVSSTNETGLHDITEILLKVALNTINQPVFNYKEDFLI